MNTRIFLISLILIVAAVSTTFAKDCAQNNVGNIVCAPPGGVLMTDKQGMIVCGLGPCVTSKNGTVLCSALAGGTATVNEIGVAVCTGKCVSPSKNNCEGAR